MSDNILECQMPLHMDDLTANIHGTGDFIIELKYCKWKVHREKFIAASTFFAKAIKPGCWKEGIEQYIKLHDECPLMFARCIETIYGRVYSYRGFFEWYGFETRCATSPDAKYLCTGMPFNPQNDFMAEVKHEKDGAIILENKMDNFANSHTRLRFEDTTPFSEREADILADDERYEPEIDILMYRLADKFGIEALRREALSQFERNAQYASYLAFTWSVLNCYLDYDSVEFDIKKIVAQGIWKHYQTIRFSEEDSAVSIREWLKSDYELCFMVMDVFGRVECLDQEDIELKGA